MFVPSVQDSFACEKTLLEDHAEVYDWKFKVYPPKVIALENIELVTESIRVHDVRVGMLIHLVKSKNVSSGTELTSFLRIF